MMIRSLFVVSALVPALFAAPIDSLDEVIDQGAKLAFEIPPLIPERVKPGPWIDGFDYSAEDQAKPNKVSPAIAPAIMGITEAHDNVMKILEDRAQLAAAAYCFEVIPSNQWTCPYCASHSEGRMQKVFYGDVDGAASGYVITSDFDQAIYLVFRGGFDFDKLTTGLLSGKTAYPPVPGAQVNAQIWNAYQAIQEDVLKEMEILLRRYEGYTINVIGHSVGGAYAELAALDIYQRFDAAQALLIKIITFGEPRVGDVQYASYFNSINIGKYRVVHDSDAIVHHPPMNKGYVHTGLEFWIVDYPEVTTYKCDAEFESMFCSNSDIANQNLASHKSYYNTRQGFCVAA
ncbi:Alpha/Beta hydrolase protein [Gongronella butleri]|nr:Alpha/Beta hydrolase protein [Gongronella butleri]